MVKNQLVSLIPLSQSQKNIWDLEQAYSGTSINHITTTVRIQGQLDLAVLQKSIQFILQSDDSLRLRVCLQEQTPMQYIAEYSDERFELFDFTQSGESGLARWEQATALDSMPCVDSPLYRFWLFQVGENEGGVLFKLHHLVSDGWSQVMLCNKIQQTYLAFLKGETPAPSPAASYEEHVYKEKEYLKSKQAQTDRLYWKNTLGAGGEVAAIKSSKSAALSPVGNRYSCVFPKSVSYMMFSYCEKNRIAPFAVFYMALAIYLKKAARVENPIIGVPVVNRASFSAKQTTGMFVSTLPFLCDIEESQSFSQFGDLFLERWYELLRHQKLPFTEIWKEAKASGQYDDRLFHIALSYLDNRVFTQKDELVSFGGKWHYSGFQAEQLCIHLSNLEATRQFTVEYDYLSQLFSEEEIHALHGSLTQILEEALSEPDKPIGKISLLPRALREKVLYEFNTTETPLPDKDLGARLGEVFASFPDRVVTIYDGRRVDYRTMHTQAKKIAAAFSQAGLFSSAVTNPLVAVLLPCNHNLFFAIAACLWAGVPYVLLSEELPAGRMKEILLQSGAQLLLTHSQHLDSEDFSSLPLQILDIESLPEAELPQRNAPESAPAYLVYTSGSTGAPKGVQISRASLHNLSHAMAPYYGTGAVLSLCSISFDAFVLESAAAILNAMTIVLPKSEEQESPKHLANLIRSYRVGFLSVTPSRLAAFLKNSDFSASIRNLQTIICGGEVFSNALLRQLQKHTGAKIYNQYGPSETTVAVSMKQLGRGGAITVGTPMKNCRLYVLDRWLQPLPVGVYGDLYVGGLCVGDGYRGEPELTKQSFLESPFEAGERMYKTGDLACWTQEGELMLAGRTDRQVKLRGLRIEPQEVAARLQGYPGIKNAATKVFDQNGQGILAAYYLSDMQISQGKLLSYLSEYLPRYMIPSYFIRLDAFPYTTSGKLDEKRLPEPHYEFTAPSVPATGLEQEILQIFATVLEKENLTPDSDYFLSGGNSLNAMETASLIGDLVGKTCRISDLYLCKTPRAIAGFFGDVLLENEEKKPAFSKAPVLTKYPLSPIQQSIYIESLRSPESFTYHMPGAFVLRHAPDIPRLQNAFYELIAREALFRTRFVLEDDGVFAKISDSFEFSLPVLEAADFADASARFLRPFDLSVAPLLRGALWQNPQTAQWVLFLDSHHIIGDGLSTPLMLQRLDRYYGGQIPDLPALSYHDYAYSLQQKAPEDATALSYWKEQLLPLPEALDLPTDWKRPKEFDYKGEQIAFSLDEALTKQCHDFCDRHEITPFMLLLGAFGVLLGAISGKKDLIIGTPVAGRSHPALQKVCGPFISTLPLRVWPDGNLPVLSYLQSVKTQVTAMLDHQNIGLEQLIEALHIPRMLSENPLYQAMFSLRPVDASAFSLGGSPVEFLPVATGSAKLDLNLEAALENGTYHFVLEYARSLFMPQTAAFYARSYPVILQNLIRQENAALGSLQMLAPQDYVSLEQNRIFNHLPYVNVPVHQLVENRALACPNQIALTVGKKEYSYAWIDNRANEIAGFLVSHGAKKGDRIAMCIKRGADLFAAQLGILKAGCAYVPFLPSYPSARIDYMIENAQVKLALLSEENMALANTLSVPAVCVSEAAQPLSVSVLADADDLMYILYTSGSTGVPKGAELCHRSVTNLFFAIKPFMEQITGPMLCITNVVFDTFFTESLFPLALGVPVVLADEDEMLLPWEIARLANTHHVQMIQFTPSRLQLCLGNEQFCQMAKNLRQIIVMGETFTNQMFEAFRVHSSARVLNMYGPTEATVYVTAGYLGEEEPSHIGTPLPGCRIYFLDANRKPVFPTARGEMYLAGICLADGYSKQPELNEKLFVPDPFFPGEKMYRSGDIARLRADGKIDFIGRTDAQIKIGGQRVELEEVSSAILRTGFIAAAALLPKTLQDGSVEIHAFVVPKDESGYTPENLNEALSQFLPSFMIPSRYILLDELPSTPSGKTDLAALKKLLAAEAPAIPAQTEMPPVNSKPVLPALDKPVGKISAVRSLPGLPKAAESNKPALATAPEDLQQELVQIWNQVLVGRDISLDTSFFEQGGSSLAALNILNRYFNLGYSLTLTQFYDHPTIRGQAALLAGSPPKPEPEPSGGFLKHTKVPAFPGRCNTALPKQVFLTGAAGFLGAHLLFYLLQNGAEQVVCLVRDDGTKLLESLCGYFGESWVQQNTEKISVIQGDLTKDFLGLAPDAYDALAEKIDAVYHSAADVRHYVQDETQSLRTNTEGTKKIIDFAKRAGARLHHISTASICGDFLIDQPTQTAVFTEEDLEIGQNWQDNPYIKSKFLAEMAVCDAIAAGLDAKIYRIGRLVGRQKDGVFQRNPDENMFYLFLQGVSQLGLLPDTMASTQIDLTPVDLCAEAVVALYASGPSAYHLVGPTFCTLAQAAQAVCPSLQIVPETDFAQALTRLAGGQQSEKVSTLIHIYNQIKTESVLKISPATQKTEKELALADVRWQKTDPQVLLQHFS